MRSAGRIVDPVVAGLYAAGTAPSAGLFGRLLGWSRSKYAASQDVQALMQAKKHIADWNEPRFLSQCGDDLRTLYAAISSGNPADLRRLAEEKMTETAFKLVEDGIAESRAAAGGAVQGAEIVEFLKEPRIGRARMIMPKMTGQMTMLQRPTHIQITTTYELLVRPFAIVPATAAARPAGAASPAGGSRGKGGRDAPRGARRTDSGAASDAGSSGGSLAAELKTHAAEEWSPVQETGKGGLTYWARGAGPFGYEHADVAAAYIAHGMDVPSPPVWHTSWASPGPSAAGVPKRPFRIEMAGVSREPRTGPDGEALVAVIQQIVWERPIPAAGGTAGALAAAAQGVPLRWRMAKLA